MQQIFKDKHLAPGLYIVISVCIPFHLVFTINPIFDLITTGNVRLRLLWFSCVSEYWKVGDWFPPYFSQLLVLRILRPFLTHGSSEGRKVSHCYRSRCCYGEPTCSSRLLLSLHSLVSTIYSIWMKLLSDEVAQLDISAKWLDGVEVCAYPSTLNACIITVVIKVSDE